MTKTVRCGIGCSSVVAWPRSSAPSNSAARGAGTRSRPRSPLVTRERSLRTKPIGRASRPSSPSVLVNFVAVGGAIKIALYARRRIVTIMGNQAAIISRRRSTLGGWSDQQDYLLRQGILKLLAVKDSDIRILTLEQCRDAVDKGLHAGGAFSAIIPLVSLYYGGFIRFDVANPTRRGQDLFTLSKGHAVAALASIYAELGYFDKDTLKNSRSHG